MFLEIQFVLSLLSKLLSLQVTQSSSKPKSKWLLVIPFDHTPEQAVSLLPITVCVYLLLLSLYGFSASIDNSSHLRQQAVLTFFIGQFLPSLVGGSYLLQWAVLTFLVGCSYLFSGRFLLFLVGGSYLFSGLFLPFQWAVLTFFSGRFLPSLVGFFSGRFLPSSSLCLACITGCFGVLIAFHR